ncbi:DUF4157 domain-containing protein [Streptomyces sp. NBC_01092]|uniref:eCIS core domain-containing protein n=1 Tax=Streptomyces sp. NBC_01092 TaxID=2903748 RepID=UPI0038663D1E|nr:DUF4157 domain-containing protein [Streptomyces sp. NBC_01092]
MSSQTQDGHAEQAAEQRRRKRKERAAKSRTPEPKDIVSGAGQPLDPGVRRELEERLGHDLSRVRLHTGRDAGQLTDLLGADAVAVGQDVFFAEGAFKPGTDEGRRLLSHELLHTVQNPHGLGTLRAGRELGAVSLPQQAIEREAESAAQDLVRDPEARPETADVEQDQATPGWLRYATVDADRSRAEAMDPATLVDRVANSVVRSLRGDPEDLSHRTRKQLARLPEVLLDGVLVRLENRLLAPEHDRVLDLVDEVEAYEDHAEALERHAHDAPQIEPDVAEEVRTERENERRDAEERKAEEQRPKTAPGPEKEQIDDEGAAGSTPQNGGTPEHGTTPQGGGAPRESEPASGAGSAGASGASRTGGGQGASAAPATRKDQSSASSASGGKSEGGQRGGQQGGEKKSQDAAGGKEKAGKEATEQEQTPAATKEESAAKNRPGAAEARVAGQQLKPQDKRGQEKPKGSPAISGKDTQSAGRISTLEGKRNQDVEGLEEETEEDTDGSGSESEVEVGGEEPSAWDIKLQPEDFLPKQDLDVSGVPTADTLDPSATPSVPSFPAPPPTRAEEVQAQRDAEDAEDEAAEAEPEEEDLAEESGSSAPETEGGPANDGGVGGLALEQAAAPPVASTATRDPKAGDDPKVGAVAAQTTVQEAPGRTDGKSEGGSEATESAAKEEKGTAAGGDKAAAAPEKESQQATGGRSAQSEAGGKEGAKESGGGSGSEAAGAQTTQAAQDTAGAAGGGSGSGGPSMPGGTSAGATTGAEGASETAPSGGTPQESAPEPSARTEAPAAAPRSAPAAQESAPAPASVPQAAAKAAPEAKSAPETAPAPKAAPSGGSSGAGGGGGGGGAAAPARGKGKKDSGPAPNLSGVAPEAGLSTASKLKPHKALQAMGGVGGAVDRTVGDEHKTLAAAPPSMQRPAGAPQTLEGKPKTDAPAAYSQDPAAQAQAPDQENAEVTGAKEPEGQIEAEKAEEPGGWDTFKMALGFIGGKIVNGVASLFGADEPVVDPQELAAKFAGLPTKDDALKQAQAGNAPGVEMQGGAEQASGEQGGHVDAKGQETIGTAQDDAGRGMGEDQVYPNAPKEQMSAKVPGRGGGGEGVAVEGGGATGAVPPEAASEVAEHERGPQFQAAFSDGQKGVSEGRQAKDRDFRDSQAKHKRQVDAEIAANTETQAGEREKAMADVTAQREGWRTEQDKELKSLGDKKSDRQEKVRQDVKDEEKKTDDKVDTEKEGSDKKVKDKADNAEKDADRQKNNAAQDSGNWLSKAFDWIKQKVIEIKNAIVRVIREARDAVITFIRDFKKNVEGWINAARKGIIDAIKNLIKDLIEFAISMVRAVIDLAKRIRNLITSLINAAIALVNRLATALKQAISDLLDSIGKLLSSILEILKKALLDVIKAVVDAVKAVLDFAAGLLNALGDFMLIAVDFLSDPGGWLSGAKNSAVDGAKNHLFREVKAAVKAWFQSKIEEIIGVPKAILDKLIKGGITLEQIVKETWDAIVPQLPFIIGEIVITKVIAKLIPGAGWVMAVIDAIRTAIGALGEILRAMGAVLDWLKAVRSGGAGILFAKAVAAGIVALLELAYEALLSGIGKYVAKVGRRFKGIAERLGRGKDGKGDGKKPAAGGADDKGGKQGDRTPADSKPETGAPTVRPTSVLPKPGKGPGSAARPEAKPVPNKPTTKAPGKDTTPDKPRDTTKPKDTDKPGQPNKSGEADKPGRPKDKDGDKQGTRPTLPPKPKPQVDSNPKPDPDVKPKDADGKSPGKPKGSDGKDGDGKPKADKPKNENDGTKKPREDGKDPTKPKGKDGKDTPGKSKDDKDTPGKSKDDKDSPTNPRHSKPPNKGPAKTKPRPDKAGPGRPKPKVEKDKQKQKEGSQDDLGKRLAIITARIRAKLLPLLDEDGMWESSFDPLLPAMKSWYGLTSLRALGDPDVNVVATLNPSSVPVRAKRWRDPQLLQPRIALKQLREDGLPKPDLPAFNGNQASSMDARFLSRSVRNTGSVPGPHSNPPGWAYVTSKGLSKDSAWVRMHLLPEKIGGMASNNNLVPAPGYSVNTPMNNELEKFAYNDIAGKGDMIWYRSVVSFHPLQKDEPGPTGEVLRGFPQQITSSYGEYDHIKGTGKHRGDWKPHTTAKKTKSIGNIRLPSPDEHTRLLINSARAKTLFNHLGGDADMDRPWGQIARYIAGLGTSGENRTTTRYGREVPDGHPHYYSVSDVQRYLDTRRASMSDEVRRLINPALAKLRKLAGAGKIDWKN